MSLNTKRFLSLIMLFSILDPFGTYHSLWQQLVVAMVISGVAHFFYLWGKDET